MRGCLRSLCQRVPAGYRLTQLSIREWTTVEIPLGCDQQAAAKRHRQIIFNGARRIDESNGEQLFCTEEEARPKHGQCVAGERLFRVQTV